MRRLPYVMLVSCALVFGSVAGAAPAKRTAPPPGRAPAAVAEPPQDQNAPTTSDVSTDGTVVSTTAAPTNAQEGTSTSSDDPWRGWPGRYSSYIGFESGTSSIGVVGRNLIVFGKWNGDVAIEYFAGFEKGADSFTTSTSTSMTGTTTTGQTNSTTNSGVKNPYILTAGAGFKKKLYQGKWLQVYAGAFGGLTYTTSANYATGSTSTTTPDVSAPTTYTVTDSNLGDVTATTDLIFFGGAKLGSEFYLRWFPNLALGFATGTFLSYGGKRTAVTNSSSQSYTVTGGTPGTPTSRTATKQESTSDPGISGTTFGIGGTSFQFTGLFTIRYVWR